jgi:hypothetical protein
MNFKPTSKGNPCPICGNTTGYCKTKIGDRHDTILYCHNTTGLKSRDQPIEGWYPMGDTSDGQWGQFTEKPPIEATGSPAIAKTPKPLKPTASPEARHAEFTGYVEGLVLHPEDRADLVRRGFTDQQIKAFGAVSIEGEEPGYLCLCRNTQRQVVGAQWRLRNPEDGTRYKWVSWIGGSKFEDQLPLACHRPPEGLEPAGVAAVEGIGAKSFLLAQRLGYVTIGAGTANQFHSSDRHWKAYLAALSEELNTRVIHFFPDSGAVENPQVWRDYLAWFDLVHSCGYSVSVAWWGQESKASASDIDELKDLASIRHITVSELREIAARRLPKKTPSTREISPQLLAAAIAKLKEAGGGLDRGAAIAKDFGLDAVSLFAAAKAVDLGCSSEDLAGPFAKGAKALNKFAQARQAEQHREEHGRFIWDGENTLDPTAKGEKFVANFGITITRNLNPPQGADFSGAVELKIDYSAVGGPQSAQIIVPSDAQIDPRKFCETIKRVHQGLNAAVTPAKLAAWLAERQRFYTKAPEAQDFQLIDRIGVQPNGYFVTENRQFTPDGEACTPEESGLVWNPKLVEDFPISYPVIAEPSDGALRELTEAAIACYPESHLPYLWLNLGSAVEALHRNEIIRVGGNNASLVTFGEIHTYKSSMIETALSPLGLLDKPAGEVTKAYLYRASRVLSGLPLYLDDPLKSVEGDQKEASKLTQALAGWLRNSFDGTSRNVCGSAQQPHCPGLWSSNGAIADGDNSAANSRIPHLNVPKGGALNQGAIPRLNAAKRAASGCFGQLYQLKYDEAAQDRVQEICEALRGSMPDTAERLVRAWAIKAYYSERVCRLAGVDFDPVEFIIRTVAHEVVELGTEKSSLADFLEKLQELQVERKVGPWCMRETDSYLAVWMPHVWKIFSSTRGFLFNYSRRTVESLAVELGGQRQALTNLVSSRETWTDYLKDLDAYERSGAATAVRPLTPTCGGKQRCLLIPIALWRDVCDPGEVEAEPENNARPLPREQRPAPLEVTPLEAGDRVTYQPPGPEEVHPILSPGDQLTLVRPMGGVWECTRDDDRRSTVNVRKANLRRAMPADLDWEDLPYPSNLAREGV